MAVLRQVADPGNSEGARWAGMRIHRIASDAMHGARLFLQAQRRMGFLLHAARMKGAAWRTRFSHAMRRHRQELDARPRRDPRPSLTGGHRSPRHPFRPRTPHLAVLSRLERSVVGAGRRPCRGRRAGEPLLAHWTATFMGGAANFLAQYFPLFLLGALFGKLMTTAARWKPSPSS